MKNFRTIIHPEPSKNKINYKSSALFLGSCFTENIGNKLIELKFPTIVNPFGVLYNPVSVRNGLEILIDQKEFKESDLDFFNEQWFSFYHDSEFSDTSKQECLNKIKSSIYIAAEQLRKAEYLVITFGTSWVYKYLKTKKIVSNCHKIPAKNFERFKLESAYIFVEWSNLISRLKGLNPNLKIIFTLSPVRHWKDGAVQNQLSKSTLLVAIHQLEEEFENVEYFPAYELMMDDLRDYRFYADDMLHPSKQAIEYIWEQFSYTYFEKETTAIINDVNKVIQAKSHRPLNKNTENHKRFRKQKLQYIENLSSKYPFIDFKKDLIFFKD